MESAPGGLIATGSTCWVGVVVERYMLAPVSHWRCGCHEGTFELALGQLIAVGLRLPVGSVARRGRVKQGGGRSGSACTRVVWRQGQVVEARCNGQKAPETSETIRGVCVTIKRGVACPPRSLRRMWQPDQHLSHPGWVVSLNLLPGPALGPFGHEPCGLSTPEIHPVTFVITG